MAAAQETLLQGELAKYGERRGYLVRCVFEPRLAAIRVRPCPGQKLGEDELHPDWHVQFPRPLRADGELFSVARLKVVRKGEARPYYAAAGKIRRVSDDALFDTRGRRIG